LLAATIKVIGVNHLSGHCLITADVARHLPKPIVSCTSSNIRAINAAAFQNELRRSLLFTQPAHTINRYLNQLHNVLVQFERVAPV